MVIRWFVLCIAMALAVIAPHVGQCVPLVGAYYYPWYGTFPGGHSWNDTLRAKLALGYVRRECNEVGTKLKLVSSAGELDATVVRLPFM